MEALKAEIELKRKTDHRLQDGLPPAKKYVRKGDLEKARQESQRLKKESEKQRLTTSSSLEVKAHNQVDCGQAGQNSKPISGTATPIASGDGENDSVPELFNISNEEAVRRLRYRGQPIRLFGESDKERRLRLRALQLIEERTEGGRNELMQALEGVEGTMDLEELARRSARDGKASNLKSGQANSAGSDDDMENAKGTHEDAEVTVDLDLIKTNPHKIYPQIYFALKRVLKEWELSMAERPDHVRRSAQGKLVAATQKQSAEYLKPLLKSLRKRDLAPDVLQAIAEIVHYMQTREYIKANDAYLRLSIGNAPWPIGVTMVGIHERSGREKIFSNNVAHVLNDEVSRKYIQSLKRILTFAQTKRPPDDLAQKMG
ncbi:hypothetical protein O181_032136 [Austropuccinia psidii MF-1]|uniref:Pre-mRNA-splicing factor 18 n=1 Tax=Austropuccinia psidii MF-1 TaxID=1389203 RepID=A0A9Q3CW80_9BASI|nr:hypothetical protein [Austropuccinia psidii MF-1]